MSLPPGMAWGLASHKPPLNTHTYNRVPTAQGKQGKWPNKFPVRENAGNLEILPKHRENTGNFVCSSSKLPDSKGKR